MARYRLAAALFAALIACDGPKRVAGGASETEATIAGRVRTPDGKSAAGVKVRLRPTYFLADTSMDAPAGGTDTLSGEDGSFRFQKVFLGDYTLEATDGERGAMTLASVDGSQDKIEADSLVLRLAATVSGRIVAPSGAVAGAFVRVFGLEHRAKTDSAGRFILAGMPAGLFDLRITPPSPGLSASSVQSVSLASGSSYDIGDLALAPALDGEDYTQWGDSARISVDTRSLSAPGTVSAFPLLIRLDRSTFDFSASTGLDLRVADARGRRLPYEIERWDPLEGKAEIWVRCDSLKAGDSAQYLTLYWNKPGAASRSDGAAVFDTADGYEGAWHVDRAAGGAALFRDASGMGNDATGDGLDSAAAVPGVSHLGQSLDGVAQALHTAKAFSAPDTFTFSLWFKTTTGNGGKLIGFGNLQTGASRLNDRQIWMDNQGRIHFGVFPEVAPGAPDHGVNKMVSSTLAYNDGQWHHAAGRLSPEGQFLFLDGEPIASDPSVKVSSHFSGFWRIGYDNFGNWENLPRSHWFQGALDEVRVARAAWSDAFIKLAYQNQKPGSTMVSRKK